MKGMLDYIYTAKVFHLFDETTQQKMAERLLDLLGALKSSGDEPGSRDYIMFGMHEGQEQEQVMKSRFSSTRYLHSPTSWTKMWSSVLERKYGEEWVKLHVKQDAYLGNVHQFSGHPIYRDFLWSVHITV